MLPRSGTTRNEMARTRTMRKSRAALREFESCRETAVEGDGLLLEPQSGVHQFADKLGQISGVQIRRPRLLLRSFGHAFLPEVRNHPSQPGVARTEMVDDADAVRVQIAEASRECAES